MWDCVCNLNSTPTTIELWIVISYGLNGQNEVKLVDMDYAGLYFTQKMFCKDSVRI